MNGVVKAAERELEKGTGTCGHVDIGGYPIREMVCDRASGHDGWHNESKTGSSWPPNQSGRAASPSAERESETGTPRGGTRPTVIVRWRGHAVEFVERYEFRSVFRVVRDEEATRFGSREEAWQRAQEYGLRLEDLGFLEVEESTAAENAKGAGR